MPHDGSAQIVNISGVASTLVLGTALTHGSNNAAMNQVSSYLPNDLARDKITVNAVIPGLVRPRPSFWRISAAAWGLLPDALPPWKKLPAR
jgi:NAD(P)-dependent dehydrogenase (short-subunit alcohol dehydrogenase family)